ncbi:Uncharacterised protein [Serratia quinivorans]|uniref:Baseplate structural protein Gp10 C-terminal domain-containing protein n=1 Tax=Serratia quinivorans TaxID=137545 RepID=A0A380AWT8_9GAMM|nr:hypothetical protein [Serratia proteamaculans]RYM60184.1 hypothetical protein BSR03_17220 [Serratia proteamaculans]SUI88287.1 Uncharacterised protein [Serratia quinivorans]
MPIEQAVYVSELVEDWPLGTDPQSAGDDHFRLVKKVIKNTLPNATGAITGTPENLNNLTDGITWRKSDTAGVPSYYSVDNPEVMREDIVQERASIAARTPSLDDVKNIPELLLTWQALQNLFYPIGSQYVNYTDSRNPSEILGFGTWVTVVGMVAGVGSATDDVGYTKTLDAGYQAGSWRVRNEQIVQVSLDLDAWTELAGSHNHEYKRYMNGGENEQNHISIDDVPFGWSTDWTSTTPDHSHAVTGAVIIGYGLQEDATKPAFFNPYYGAYIWRRTE